MLKRAVGLFSGPYQNETGPDGIGDTPYQIDANDTDMYPLMGPWTNIDEQVDINDPTGAEAIFH